MKTTGNILVGICAVAVVYATSVARADFAFGEPVNLGSRVNGAAGDLSCCLSYDGLELYFASDRGGGQGGLDLWVSTRPTREEDWGPPRNLGSVVNSAQADLSPSISADGLELYFHANSRPGGFGGSNIWVTRRETKDAPWGEAENLGPTINATGWAAYNPCISSDGLVLYFAWGGWVAVTRRAAEDDPWEEPVDLTTVVNSWESQDTPWISSDGCLLVFTDNAPYPPRPGGFGGTDIWCSRRATTDSSSNSLYNPHFWESPVNVGPRVNTSSREDWSMISPDGSTLYFSSNRSGGFGGLDLWQAPIIRIMDFNTDGKVDAQDMGLLADNWGQSKLLCDIAPFAWGDGVVGEQDLRVLMESLMTPGPKAGDVPCDVVLSWISPSFAHSHDVYLGTSYEEVNNATRDDPCGVLVSEGQVETTYTPEGLLEFERTYYWRVNIVEVVIGSTEPVIYKGPILSFTIEPFMRPIQNIIATASGSQAGMGPQNTVNGSGLDQNDGHSSSNTDMWQSAATPGPHWIQYEFDQVYTLHELWVWNSNQAIEPFIGFGAKTVRIECSSDGTAWTVLDEIPEFARAPGQPGYTHNTVVTFGGISAKYVRLTIEANWGGVSPSIGLSEVRFFYIPDRTVSQP